MYTICEFGHTLYDLLCASQTLYSSFPSAISYAQNVTPCSQPHKSAAPLPPWRHLSRDPLSESSVQPVNWPVVDLVSDQVVTNGHNFNHDGGMTPPQKLRLRFTKPVCPWDIHYGALSERSDCYLPSVDCSISGVQHLARTWACRAHGSISVSIT